MENALKDMKWDIIGLAEVRRKSIRIIERNSGLLLMHSDSEKGQCGVGFVVNKNWKSNVIEFKVINTRIAILRVRINERKELIICQIYAPTATSNYLDRVSFYTTLDSVVSRFRKKKNTVIVMGDWNGRVGRRLNEEKSIMGNCWYGTRNEAGEMIINFAFSHELKIGNSYFTKKSKNKWTWKAPDGKKYEMDYMLISSMRVVNNIKVMSRFNFNTDHRLIRASLVIKKMKQERFLVNTSNVRNLNNKGEINSFQELLNLNLKTVEFKANNIQDTYNLLINNVKRSLSAVKNKNGTKRKYLNKLSEKTLELLDERKQLKINDTEHHKITCLNNIIRKEINNDLMMFEQKKILEIMESTRSIKKLKKELSTGRNHIVSLESVNKKKITERKKIVGAATDFYRKLYDDSSTDSGQGASKYQYVGEPVPAILKSEVEVAIGNLKTNKSPGDDGIRNEVVKAGGQIMVEVLTCFFNEILLKVEVPSEWNEAKIILIHKKGDQQKIDNYRPISLTSVFCKLFTKIMNVRLTSLIGSHISVEQAGFRKGFSVTDHLHTVNQLIEKSMEYNFELHLGFVDFTKAFDSISHLSIIRALEEMGVDYRYISIIQALYSRNTAFIDADVRGESFAVKRGVRQGDPLSPTLFVIVLEYIFRRLPWEGKGININGKFLNNLKFADDIVVIGNSGEQLSNMMKEMYEICLEVGLGVNFKKTKVLTNGCKRDIFINSEPIEVVDEVVYLGQTISFKNRLNKEIQRRTAMSWNKYWSLKMIMKGNLKIQWKSLTFNTCILPVLTYGCQTWSMTRTAVNKIERWQRSVERSMLNIRKSDKWRATKIRKLTSVRDAALLVKKLKWEWAGHISRREDERWTKLVTEWTPLDMKRRRGRQFKRWRDELTKEKGVTWWRQARDRHHWRELCNKIEERAASSAS